MTTLRNLSVVGSTILVVNMKKKITKDVAQKVGKELGINFEKYSLEQFRKGMMVEQEHEDVTKGILKTTGKIALAHLKEIPDYYSRLNKMEKKAPKRKTP